MFYFKLKEENKNLKEKIERLKSDNENLSHEIYNLQEDIKNDLSIYRQNIEFDYKQTLLNIKPTLKIIKLLEKRIEKEIDLREDISKDFEIYIKLLEHIKNHTL